ncbi:hypothetical protein [Kitasatospora sp. KL5]|uniref:hypothetical protein n=1 Tax=Kitasatospora sp. KL5 TaxID=3425125 RepID=UPI003D6E64A3
MELHQPAQTDHHLSLHTALVHCPRCDSRALRTGARLVCTSCGLVRETGRSFAGPVLVTAGERCPTCGRTLRHAAEHAAWPGTVRDRALRCGCGTRSRHPVAVHPSWHRNQGADPVSGLPLWLRTGVRGNVLWALDAAHLDAVEAQAEGPADVGAGSRGPGGERVSSTSPRCCARRAAATAPWRAASRRGSRAPRTAGTYCSPARLRALLPAGGATP